MDAALQAPIIARAGGRCEYCHLPAEFVILPFQIDHIIAQQHDGPTILSNLAYGCLACNKRKGPNLTGIDSKTHKPVRLFHPRRRRWHRHSRWQGPVLLGRTAMGRITIKVLAINDPLSVETRRVLIEEGVFSFD